MDILKSLPIRDEAGTKRPIPIEIEEEKKSKRAKLSLGLNVHDDFFEIEEIEKKALPREDGYPWSVMQQTVKEEEKRPYNKAFLKDRADRERILSHNKDYRFSTELAGALRKELSDIIEPEDMERLRREQEYERAQIDIELKRTRVSMEKKYGDLERLKKLEKEEEGILGQLRRRRASYALRSNAKYLVDQPSPLTTINSYYGFLDLVRLYNTYGDEAVTRNERDTLVNEEMKPVDMLDKSEEWLNLFFYLFVYYRDFLNNESNYWLEDSIVTKVSYVLDHYNDFEEVVPSSSTTTTTTTTVKIESVAGRLGLVGGNDPVAQVQDYFKRRVQGGVDWVLYKKRQSETINMTFFAFLGIAPDTEQVMAQEGASGRYGKAFLSYMKRLMFYLYSGESGVFDWGQEPQEIRRLIQIQYPNYIDKSVNEEVKLLLRSHFLWLYFENTKWPEITNLLLPRIQSIFARMRDETNNLREPLLTTMNLYKSFLLSYFKRVVATEDSEPLFVLTPTQRLLLMSTPATDNLEEEARRFDKINALFVNVQPVDMATEDALFADYIRVGGEAFVNDQFGGETPKSKAPGMVVPEEYPILLLHRLFMAAQQFNNEYVTSSTNNLERIKGAIKKATKKIAEVVGDESFSLSNGQEYRQRKQFTTRPENSGFVKMRAEIVHLIRKAYQLVRDYCDNLRELPLEEFQSDSAYEAGLSTDFISYIAVLAADGELMFPDGYRSQKYYTKVKEEKQAAMARLRRYSWEGRQPNVIIRKDVPREMRPCFAMPLYRSSMMF